MKRLKRRLRKWLGIEALEFYVGEIEADLTELEGEIYMDEPDQPDTPVAEPAIIRGYERAESEPTDIR